jgi:hypothetical protein
MELNYALLADKASRLYDGKLVIFGGDIDQVNVGMVPAIAQISLVARVTCSAGEGLDGNTFGIECTPPVGDKIIVAANQAMERFGEEKRSTRLIVDLVIAFSSAGTHLIHLLMNGQELTTLPLDVKLTPNTETK